MQESNVSVETRSALILIPARYESTRFPGKPLTKILDKTMIQWVFEGASMSGYSCYVVTDDERIEKEVATFEGKCLRVDDDVKTGSERIGLAYGRYFSHSPFDYVVNLQGDEPLICGDLIKRGIEKLAESKADIVTVVRERKGKKGLHERDTVKVAFSPKTGRCHYFSRAAIPYGIDEVDGQWYQHIGIYFYRAQSLNQFLSFDSTPLEKAENLEQLRALENTQTIMAIETQNDFVGVDRPEDIKKVEEVLRGK